MEYAARLLTPRSVLVPALALAIGAGGAVGIYSALDEPDVGVQATRVVVTEPPAKPGPGVAAKHESATAAAIAQPGSHWSADGSDEAASAATSSPRTWLESKDEAKTADAIGTDEGRRGGGPPAENDADAPSSISTDPHAPAAALP
ncbi:MAG: hypothetical protein ACRDLY_18520 [Thermoleophilaceae bacterium]